MKHSVSKCHVVSVSSPHKHRVLLPVILVTALLLACAGAVSWVYTRPAPASASARSAHPRALPDGVELVATPAAGDPAQVANMTTESVATTQDRTPRTGTYPTKPDALAPPVADWVGKAVAQFEGQAGGADSLDVSWAPVLEAGPIFGVDLEARAREGRAGSTFFTSLADGQVWTGAQIFADQAADQVDTLMGRALRLPDTGVQRKRSELTPPALKQIGTDARAVTQVRADGVYLPVPGTARSLRMTPAAAQGLLSDAGKAVLAAAQGQAPFVGIPAPPPPVAPDTGSPHVEGGVALFPGADHVDCASAKCIALTFDDGPGARTGEVLDILKAHGAHATFFVLGNRVASGADTIRRAVAEGNVIGNHSWDHADLAKLTPEQVSSELTRTADALAAIGVPRPLIVRPPYGSLSPDARQVVRTLGLTGAMWSVDTLDWKTKDTQKTIDAALGQAHPGGIILMHDIHDFTVDAVATIVTGLQAQGYTLVTVPELFSGHMKVGVMYGQR